MTVRRHPIQIVTTSAEAQINVLKSDTGLVTKDIDFKDKSDRKWLDSHIMWALNNGRAVILNPR